jgi:hypothetical protein
MIPRPVNSSARPATLAPCLYPHQHPDSGTTGAGKFRRTPNLNNKVPASSMLGPWPLPCLRIIKPWRTQSCNIWPGISKKTERGREKSMRGGITPCVLLLTCLMGVIAGWCQEPASTSTPRFCRKLTLQEDQKNPGPPSGVGTIITDWKRGA